VSFSAKFLNIYRYQSRMVPPPLWFSASFGQSS